ncbi:peroxidase 20-like [Macadamia integrifolia]|uniref:peroxidase 20-like n=1 Tax=Macadamia integrifolia TaxID=60698 RepID=UPI001C5005F7|nr:peroxidase 20-like [Macadamia integrifolia]
MEVIKSSLMILALLFLHGAMADSNYNGGLLYFDYYKESCPLAEEIVRRNVEVAVLKEPRMAASLLRLHFHDCFVMGCDASVLLDSYGDIQSEKQAGPNLNSARGFEVIDEIKAILEHACPCTVSCADILALIARDAVELRGGPRWEVGLGRKDSLKASFNGANQFIPAPNSSLDTLIASFQAQGLDIWDLVALSGSHTIGKSRCTSFRQRIYNNMEEEYDYYKRYKIFNGMLRSFCPRSRRDDAVVPLDFITSARFDNKYYINLLQGKGLLGSDNVLITQDHEGHIVKQVWSFASDQRLFFKSFVKSMIKMGSINVLTGEQGEIRRNCRFVNSATPSK